MTRGRKHGFSGYLKSAYGRKRYKCTYAPYYVTDRRYVLWENMPCIEKLRSMVHNLKCLIDYLETSDVNDTWERHALEEHNRCTLLLKSMTEVLPMRKDIMDEMITNGMLVDLMRKKTKDEA